MKMTPARDHSRRGHHEIDYGGTSAPCGRLSKNENRLRHAITRDGAGYRDDAPPRRRGDIGARRSAWRHCTVRDDKATQ